MGTKNNPQNRGKVNTKKKLNGKEIEPVLVCLGSKRFMGAKFSKTVNIICDNDGNPRHWEDIESE